MNFTTLTRMQRIAHFVGAVDTSRHIQLSMNPQTNAIVGNDLVELMNLFAAEKRRRSVDDQKENQNIMQGFVVDEPDENGNSPLVLALCSKWLTGLQLLIEYGLDLNALDNSGTTLLILAVCMRWGEGVTFLVDRGADVNGQGRHGITPVIAAICNGWTTGLRLLISYEADVNIQADHGLCAIHFATRKAL